MKADSEYWYMSVTAGRRDFRYRKLGVFSSFSKIIMSSQPICFIFVFVTGINFNTASESDNQLFQNKILTASRV